MTRFPATRHSMVAAIRSEQADVRRSAFDTLVTAYWKPVFKYLRLKWHASAEDAADLTQAFFLRAFEKAFFADFDPRRARRPDRGLRGAETWQLSAYSRLSWRYGKTWPGTVPSTFRHSTSKLPR